MTKPLPQDIKALGATHRGLVEIWNLPEPERYAALRWVRAWADDHLRKTNSTSRSTPPSPS